MNRQYKVTKILYGVRGKIVKFLRLWNASRVYCVNPCYVLLEIKLTFRQQF